MCRKSCRPGGPCLFVARQTLKLRVPGSCGVIEAITMDRSRHESGELFEEELGATPIDALDMAGASPSQSVRSWPASVTAISLPAAIGQRMMSDMPAVKRASARDLQGRIRHGQYFRHTRHNRVKFGCQLQGSERASPSLTYDDHVKAIWICPARGKRRVGGREANGLVTKRREHFLVDSARTCCYRRRPLRSRHSPLRAPPFRIGQR